VQPASLEQLALALAEQSHGVLTRSQLKQLGLSPKQIDHLLDSGRWERLTSVIFRVVGSPRTSLQRTTAAVADCGPKAVLSRWSAASMWGLAGCPLEPFTTCRTGSPRRGSDLARIHQVRVLPSHWCTSLEGIPIVRPEFLALQIFSVSKEARAERLVDNLWSQHLLTGASITQFLDDLGRSGRNGTAGLRRYLADRGPNYRPSDSNLESRLRQILQEAGIFLQPQVNVGTTERWTGRVDFRHPNLPLIIEVQSSRYHDALVDQRADATRMLELRSAGFYVLEITDAMVWTRPSEVVRIVGEAIDRCRNTPSLCLAPDPL
jgi:very-short-patch-repair endonuclease